MLKKKASSSNSFAEDVVKCLAIVTPPDSGSILYWMTY